MMEKMLGRRKKSHLELVVWRSVTISIGPISYSRKNKLEHANKLNVLRLTYYVLFGCTEKCASVMSIILRGSAFLEFIPCCPSLLYQCRTTFPAAKIVVRPCKPGRHLQSTVTSLMGTYFKNSLRTRLFPAHKFGKWEVLTINVVNLLSTIITLRLR